MSLGGQCPFCIHAGQDGRTCAAFPDGIPMDIIGGQADHTEPFEGDNGIRFEPIDADDDTATAGRIRE